MKKPGLYFKPNLTLDMDTALEDGQWAKLKEFLTGKLEDDDLDTVESICRRGGDAPESKPMPGEDRRRATNGAADTAIGRYQQHQADVRDKHRRGLISDADLAGALVYGKITAEPKKPVAVAYDGKSFPDSGRLK